MRIVAGRFRGARLAGPAPGDSSLRPTSDRLRETLFNILAHRPEGDPVGQARVLDLFAGTGALGLEALSRGAHFCLFVEERAQARALIRRNIEALSLTGATKVYRRDATRLGPAGTLGRFSLAFLDPPYGRGLAERALVSARDGGWLEDGAAIVVEEARKGGFAAPEGFAETGRRQSGDSELIFLSFAGTSRV
jgi:16S rRNA (guanine966-N2)-methyltransferase